MSYSVAGGALNFPATSGQGENFSGLFAWTARVDSWGNLQGSGAATLVLDLGSGPEILMTGSVIGFGARDGARCGETQLGDGTTQTSCSLVTPQVAIVPVYLDSRAAAYLGDYMIWLGSFTLAFGESLSLSENFDCTDFSAGNAPSCGRYSGDALIGYVVPEPGILVLLSLGIAGLTFARRRKLN